MQYTLRDIPPALDRALRQRARRQKRSLNAVAIEVLIEAFGLTRPQRKRRKLADLAGSYGEDAEVEAALADQRHVDEALWR